MCAHNGFIPAQDNKNDVPHHNKQESDLKIRIFDVQGSCKAIFFCPECHFVAHLAFIKNKKFHFSAIRTLARFWVAQKKRIKKFSNRHLSHFCLLSTVKNWKTQKTSRTVQTCICLWKYRASRCMKKKKVVFGFFGHQDQLIPLRLSRKFFRGHLNGRVYAGLRAKKTISLLISNFFRRSPEPFLTWT